MMTESDVLDKILEAFVPMHLDTEKDIETLADLLNALGSDEAVLMLHQAIHKYFGD